MHDDEHLIELSVRFPGEKGMTNKFTVCLATMMAFVTCAASAEDLSFNRDIRPLLAENCFQCHGPDPGPREAELRFDIREIAVATRDGSAAIVPGDADASGLIVRVNSQDPDLRMPPAETGKRLTVEQIEQLRRWIDSGANYQRHWAFEPVRVHPLPEKTGDAWANNPIDRFVLEKLRQNGLRPSLRADRYTLLRRLYLDLLGVLPSIAEAEAFDADNRPDAYERLVERVLARPAFGERWGRHWLDQARYADSHGYTNDNERVMWPYRDGVIAALNRDQPFNQFTIEQLAGDLLPDSSLAQTIASGFHRNTLINTEGGTKADQFRDEQVKDRVDTTGGVWLGLTVGCAKCHSHKYDPISQTEYYQLYAFFNSTVDNNSVPPVVKAPTANQRNRTADLNRRHTQLMAKLENDQQRTQRQQEWETALVKRYQKQTTIEPTGLAGTKWIVLELDGKSDDGATFTSSPDRSLLVSGKNTIADFYQLTARSPLTTIRSVRLEVLTHADLPHQGPGRADNGNFVLAEFWFRTGDGRELRFSKAQADHSQPKFEVTATIDNDADSGWAINGSPEGGPNHNRTAWFVLPTPLEVEKDHALTFNLQHHRGQRPYNIGRLRLSISADEWMDAPSQQQLAKLVGIPPEKRGPAQRKRIDDAFLRNDPTLGPVFTDLQSVARARDQLNSQVASTMVMRELDEPRPTHLQRRGDFLKPADEVACDVPAALPAMPPSDTPRTRLDFAKWLVRDDNPLTPRVRVNRLWMRLFGKGLVETENDFGTQGALPTHLKLLDWMAAEHIRQGWSTKQLLRLITTSATYQQRSNRRDIGVKIDPQNQLLWRQNRIRVEGEIVRDLALSAGGLRSAKIGGPSVYPPQPEGVYAFTQREKNWRTSTGEDRYRRGMYTFFYRSAPYPMLTTFDAPKFNQTCTRRDRSNTPIQSLTVANDPTMFEAAQALGLRIILEVQSDPTGNERLARLFRICMVRPPSKSELNYLQRFLQRQRKHFHSNPGAATDVAPDGLPDAVSPIEAASLVAVARVVLNLDEFITRE
jgi:hypothetical protein